MNWNSSDRFVILDLDGSVADLTHRLPLIQGEKKEWDLFHAACSDDKPIWPIIVLVRLLSSRGLKIIIVTGRPYSSEETTRSWLRGHSVPFDYLFMRPTDNHWLDSHLKQEILWNELPPTEQISYVLEDRNQVVEMWRRNGLTCLQVADGDY